jgi:hypothetical protein
MPVFHQEHPLAGRLLGIHGVLQNMRIALENLYRIEEYSFNTI